MYIIYNNLLCDLEFALVHNGIVTNYKDIKSFLVSQQLLCCVNSLHVLCARLCEQPTCFLCPCEYMQYVPSYLSLSLLPPPQTQKGFVFETETDTEVIAKLLKHLYDNHKNQPIKLRELVEMTVAQLVSDFFLWLKT